jgi:tRNA A58 N-methylase Trm61
MLRAWIYEVGFRPFTTAWYAEVLSRLPTGARLLDVGVGTAGSLVRNGDLLRERDLHVVGVDIDADYLRAARKQIARWGLEDRIEVRHTSIHDFEEMGFHAAYFGASFMLMPHPSHVLRHVGTLLRPGGKVYFTQTFQESRSTFWERAKPLLHKVTTIHFGNVTYEADFLKQVDDAGFRVLEHVTMSGGGERTARLVVAEVVPDPQPAG